MKTYNALSKSFTDEVKAQMGGGKSIDEAFKLVKLDIVGGDFDEPTVTPESTPTPKPDLNIPTPAPESPTPAPESTPTPSPGSTLPPEITTLTEGSGQKIGKDGKFYHYVDLDLPTGTMWATCNLGAESALGDGLLFQFGRVDGYAYNDSSNQFRTNAQNKQDTGNSYIPLTTSGKTYNAGETLDSADDAAHVNMGDTWRMPTNSDIKELYDYTTYQLVTISNVHGVMFKSTSNENRLFIPLTKGLWNGGGWKNCGNPCAYLWSSQVYADSANSAYILSCGTSNVAYINASDTRCYALPVRGVF